MVATASLKDTAGDYGTRAHLQLRWRHAQKRLRLQSTQPRVQVQLEVDSAPLPACRVLIGAHTHIVECMLLLAARLAAVHLVRGADALHYPARSRNMRKSGRVP